MAAMTDTEKMAAHAGYTITWKDVNLDISTGGFLGLGSKKTIRTLRNAAGYARPGESLAIIGPSGAGKTTLLDILAQQKSLGDISGEILVNGKKPDLFFAKRAGYIFTAMAHIPTMTVRETVMFAAECRMPREATYEEKVARVDEVIKNLRLTGAVNTYVGDELIRGVSSGEKKRTEVAIEMVARPKALFFDEPTSGLDDYGARFTMELVLDYVRRENVSVMVVIHQPCEAVFKLFDNCCLIGDQGRVCYFGPISRCEEFFTSFGYPTPPLTNPIEHYLDVMALDMVRAHEFYEKSPLFQENLREIERLKSMDHPDVPHSKNLVEIPWNRQFKLIWDRCWLRYWRNPSTSWGRAGLFVGFAIMFGLMFLKLDNDIGGMRNRLSVASTLSFLPIFVAVAAVPQFLEDRELYIQEYNSAFYNLWPFWLTYVVIETIYNIVISTIEYIIIFYMSNAFDNDKFGIGYAMMLVQMFLATAISQSWSAWCKTLFQAYTALWAAGLIFYAFSGTQAPLQSVRPWIRWMADVNYWRWAQQYIDYHLLKDFTFNCPTIPTAVFAPGVVAGQKSNAANLISANGSDPTVTGQASSVLNGVNALLAMKTRSGATADNNALIDTIVAAVPTTFATVLNRTTPATTLLTSGAMYGTLDTIDIALKNDTSYLPSLGFCPVGDYTNRATGWLDSYRGIGVNEPATTGWAYFANGMLWIFFTCMTYTGLWFSRRYRKR